MWVGGNDVKKRHCCRGGLEADVSVCVEVIMAVARVRVCRGGSRYGRAGGNLSAVLGKNADSPFGDHVPQERPRDQKHDDSSRQTRNIRDDKSLPYAKSVPRQHHEGRIQGQRRYGSGKDQEAKDELTLVA